jgi:hypothetical protein
VELSKHLSDQIHLCDEKVAKLRPLLNTIDRIRNLRPMSRARNPNESDDIAMLHNKLRRKPKSK